MAAVTESQSSEAEGRARGSRVAHLRLATLSGLAQKRLDLRLVQPFKGARLCNGPIARAPAAMRAAAPWLLGRGRLAGLRAEPAELWRLLAPCPTEGLRVGIVLFPKALLDVFRTSTRGRLAWLAEAPPEAR